MDKLEQTRSEIDRIDRDMAALFSRRMEAVRDIASYKQARGLPVADPRREAMLLSRGAQAVPEELRGYYSRFQSDMMAVSRQYQSQLMRDPSFLRVDLGPESYDVILERGCLKRASDLLDLNRRVFIVTDDGVPTQYAGSLAEQCRESCTAVIPRGEASKSFQTLEMLLKRMADFNMTRFDCVAAVGGGVVGDLAGLAASLYLRGVDYYIIPTTMLSQVDSSIGGKTAIDLAGIKNAVGTFYQPKRVLLDPDVLSTLPARQMNAGLAEALKTATALDPALFALFEEDDIMSHLDEIIAGSVQCKAQIVSADARESGVRRVLNFGHTIGHALESSHTELLHGECVALGMLPMCGEAVRARLLPICEKLRLPSRCVLDPSELAGFMAHDKKKLGSELLSVEVPEIGRYQIQPIGIDELMSRLAIITRGADER